MIYIEIDSIDERLIDKIYIEDKRNLRSTHQSGAGPRANAEGDPPPMQRGILL
jgi:hypothetical protein